ncbi:hypothetical protein BOX15_Mlig017886g2 [Macrostomum lignano]|uniref:Glutathione peroxidase n=1 Tax=Macrostomum lignano TaxID=282301 RepID=A0A267EDH8_9PLAT|nr:hypothetical protein BOX15_Mlig017886g2 [Macrostomum lignano]
MLYRKGLVMQLPLLFSLCMHQPVSRAMASSASGTVYDFSAKTIDGDMVSLSKYKGRVLVVTNVACL